MSAKAKGKGKKALPKGLGSDGMPRLPPIPTSAVRKDDPYAKSKLLTHRAAKEKQNLLTKIMLDNAVQAYEATVDHNKHAELTTDNNDEPAYPAQVRTFIFRVISCYVKSCLSSYLKHVFFSNNISFSIMFLFLNHISF